MRVLDYGRPALPPPSKRLAWCAHLTALYPLFFLALFYGEWLLAWWALGHPPRPMLDDPKDIAGLNWMNGIVGVALMAYFPASVAALVLNTLYAINARLRASHLVLRIIVLLCFWVGTVLLLRWDPGRIVYWWFD